MAALAGESDQVSMAAVVAPDTGETILQTAAIEVAEYSLPYFRSQIPQTSLIPFLVYPLQLLETVFNTAVIVG